MKKRIFISIPIITAIVIFSGLAIINNRLTPAWENKLNLYLAYLRAEGSPSFKTIAQVQAVQPENFTPSMTTESFSDSAIFQTSIQSSAQFSADLQPLAYPPKEVWCVMLENDKQRQVVFVALHDSLYNADWIVHIPPDPWGSNILQETLATIGCSFE